MVGVGEGQKVNTMVSLCCIYYFALHRMLSYFYLIQKILTCYWCFNLRRLCGNNAMAGPYVASYVQFLERGETFCVPHIL